MSSRTAASPRSDPDVIGRGIVRRRSIAELDLVTASPNYHNYNVLHDFGREQTNVCPLPFRQKIFPCRAA
jgi:hypothetical protein